MDTQIIVDFYKNMRSWAGDYVILLSNMKKLASTSGDPFMVEITSHLFNTFSSIFSHCSGKVSKVSEIGRIYNIKVMIFIKHFDGLKPSDELTNGITALIHDKYGPKIATIEFEWLDERSKCYDWVIVHPRTVDGALDWDSDGSHYWRKMCGFITGAVTNLLHHMCHENNKEYGINHD